MWTLDTGQLPLNSNCSKKTYKCPINYTYVLELFVFMYLGRRREEDMKVKAQILRKPPSKKSKIAQEDRNEDQQQPSQFH